MISAKEAKEKVDQSIKEFNNSYEYAINIIETSINEAILRKSYRTSISSDQKINLWLDNEEVLNKIKSNLSSLGYNLYLDKFNGYVSSKTHRLTISW